MGFKGRRGGGECGFGKRQVIGEKCSTVIITEKALISLTGNSFVVTSCSKTAPHA